jgi:hypothetical protein
MASRSFGLLTLTAWKRRSSEWSFSTDLPYSPSVFAPFFRRGSLMGWSAAELLQVIRVRGRRHSGISVVHEGPFHSAQDTVGFGDAHRRDRVRPILGIGDGIDSQLVRIARRAYMRHVTIVEGDP